jgi:glycosyltransferase involved in cell wall biosynthesis
MQTRHESILRAVNNKSGKYNVLTAPTHERTQFNMSSLKHTFYLFQYKGFKPWNFNYAPLPENHILLDGSDGQIRPDMKFDIVLSQNRFGQIQVLGQIADQLGLPHVSIEHTTVPPFWNKKQLQAYTSPKADRYVFITEHSCKQWGFDPKANNVDILPHGIPLVHFTENKVDKKDGKILTVQNDYINRNWCLNFELYLKLTKNLPTNPVGDTPNFSKGSTNIPELVSKYHNASVFLNTTNYSPLPHALLEAAACECPIVTTDTCGIPELIQDGYNGFISNDEEYLIDRLKWCLKNPDEAKELGKNARKTIIEKFSLNNHLNKLCEILDKVYGKACL